MMRVKRREIIAASLLALEAAIIYMIVYVALI